jgi:hypothetical protein
LYLVADGADSFNKGFHYITVFQELLRGAAHADAFGRASSSTSVGVAVYGINFSTVGGTGVIGQTNSPNGFAGQFFGGRRHFEGSVGIGENDPVAKLHILAEDGTAPC